MADVAPLDQFYERYLNHHRALLGRQGSFAG
jgi:hypothetical protein